MSDASRKVLRRGKAADRLLAAVRKRGGEPRDPRDAAHEACHALDAKLKGPWTRDNIHEALTKFCGDRGVMLYHEIRARAVEMVVCQQLDIPYDVEQWASTCYLEQVSVARIAPPSFEWLLEQIKRQSTMAKTTLMAKRILGLRA